MAILDTAKLHLRIASANTTLDTEVQGLIDAAKADMALSGITVDDTDALTVRAICTYCKANFGWDNPEAERLQKAYDMIKGHLASAADYTAAEEET